jgi:hypothetical protein
VASSVLCGLEVEGQLEFYGLLDRQVGWFLAFQPASATFSRPTPMGELTAPVADEFRPPELRQPQSR